MQLFLKILSGMASSVEAHLICTVCICHFVIHFGARNLGHLPVFFGWARVVGVGSGWGGGKASKPRHLTATTENLVNSVKNMFYY